MFDAPLPPQVEGYAEARARGLLPVVGEQPPRLLPGPTADQASLRVLAALAATMVAVVAAGKVGSAVFGGGGALAVVVGLVALVALTILYRAWARVGERNLAELRRGYTTLSLTAGSFWHGDLRRFGRFGHRPPWDYRGVWVLANDGTVTQAPDHAVVAPGLYPSPNRPGRWEVWTGQVWTGDFRPSPERPEATSDAFGR